MIEKIKKTEKKEESLLRIVAIFAVQILCGVGASVLVGVAVNYLTPANISTFKKVGIALVGFGVAGVVANAASENIVDVADTVIDMIGQVAKPLKGETV